MRVTVPIVLQIGLVEFGYMTRNVYDDDVFLNSCQANKQFGWPERT